MSGHPRRSAGELPPDSRNLELTAVASDRDRSPSFQRGPRCLSDGEVIALVASRHIPTYKLDAVLETPERGVAIRREMLSSRLPLPAALSSLPYKNYDYAKV